MLLYRSMLSLFFRLAGTLLLVVSLQAAATPATTPAVDPVKDEVARPFSPGQVRIQEGPFRDAQKLDRQYIWQLDPDRLLSGFRSEAGLTPKAPKYPNWESSGLDGHTAGHYLSALALLAAATDDRELKQRLDYMVAEMAECQRANGDGYVGGVLHSKEFWSAIRTGQYDVQNFSLKGAWVPWYNVHKTFAGLYDAWRVGRNEQARTVLTGLADWCGEVIARLSDDQLQAMLKAEHGGMNEALANVYAMTGDRKYLRLAQRFSHRAVLDPLLRHEDRLTGLHTNTQIPKVLGFARIAELGGDPAWADAAAFFWDTVVVTRSIAVGGVSVREHFNPPHDFATMLESREGPESCATYNLLKLTEQLFRQNPAARYADYYERALFNHILSLQHPGDGGLVYFTPIRPQHYRVYSQPEQCFWCCVGTGMENPGRFGEFIYAHGNDALWVNLFVASELNWTERGVQVRQETRFPDEARTELRLTVEHPEIFSLHLRHPGWVSREDFSITVNGQPIAAPSAPGSYVEIRREWRTGDRVEVALPMRTTVEPLAPGSDYVALLHGPIVLAAATAPAPREGLMAGDGRMGHVAPGAFLPLDEAPMLVGARDQLAAALQPVAGKPLTFTAPGLIRPGKFAGLEFVPFFRLHDARYMIYWRTTTDAEYAAVRAEIAQREQARVALEARTLDQVAPGEQQPEVEHHFQNQKSESGSTVARTWRSATGWFSYQLRAGAAPGPLVLQVTTYEMEERNVQVEINGRRLGEIRARGWKDERFTEHTFPISAELIAASPDRTLTVRFSPADPARPTGGIYEVRLLRQ